MRSKIRAAWFADIFDEVSGIVTDTVEIYKQAQINGIPWYPLTCYPKNIEPFYAFKPILNFPTGFAYKGSKIYFPNFTSVINFLKEKEINIIISNTPAVMGFTVMAASVLLKIPWVDIYHTDVDFYMNALTKGPLKLLINKTAFRFVKIYQKRANLIFIRNQDYHDLMLKKGHPEKKLRHYPPGVDISRFSSQFKDRSIWKKFNIDSNKTIILFVGRITKVKDLEFLLKAFSENAWSDAELAIVGKGPEYKLYNNRYDSFNNIHFLGIQKGEILQKIYASSGLFVLPSASETLGKTVLEAMASGLPVLVSDKGGPKDHVREAVNGRLFKAGDYGEFLKTLKEMLDQKKDLNKMGEVAYRTVQNYTMENLFKNFVEEIGYLIKE